MSKDDLGDRMKSFYEDAYRISLPMRMPVVIRVDGRSFHNYTKDCKRPFDDKLVNAMNVVAIELCKEIQGTQLAYVQSDEISVLVVNYSSLDSEAWFSNNLQKMVSVSAGIASSVMTEESIKIFGKLKRAEFDSRAFVLPKEEVCNYFLFRQQDATRNSVQMLARSLYSHKQLDGKNNSDLHEMIYQKGHNWDDLPTAQKRGRCIVKQSLSKPAFNPKTGKQTSTVRNEWVVDDNTPVFSKDRMYIDSLVYTPKELDDSDPENKELWDYLIASQGGNPDEGCTT